ncbi:MAG: hypothetical protein KGJ07_03965 [Patescibacteria group bacterium]|nr:hypothetical protein [Patescibacteria group bacterium]
MKRKHEITFIKHDAPKTKLPKSIIDRPLHKRLDKNPITKNLNKSAFWIVTGPPGSGKTSFVTSMFDVGCPFYQLFDYIHAFMPENNLKSLEDCLWHDLPEEQLHYELTADELDKIEEDAKKRREEDENSEEHVLIVIDDMQAHLKEKEIQKVLNRLAANRRHLNMTIIIMLQNYILCPKQTRKLGTDFFAFNLTTDDAELLRQEHVELEREIWDNVRNTFLYRLTKSIEEAKEKNERPKKHFLYLNKQNQQYFIDYDELVLPSQRSEYYKNKGVMIEDNDHSSQSN